MEEATVQPAVTRRSFLKTTGAAIGIAALAGTGSTLTALAIRDARAADEDTGDQTFRSGCRGNCGSRCPMEVTVREGKVVKTRAAEYPEADLNRRRLCVKGYSQPQRVYDPDRVKYPMRRAEGTERGGGEWERVSWDDAIAEMAEKIGTAVAEYGGSSIAFWSSYGSYGILNGAMSGYLSVSYGRMITILGATVLGAGADTAQQYVQATLLGISGNDFLDAANAKTIMCWGGNPAEAYVHAWQFVCDAHEKGATLITIDPQYTAAAMHSDVYIPIRPATDGALMLAMANYIVEHDLHDKDFMRDYTVSPYLVKEDGTYLRMSDLGVPPTEGPISATTGMPTTIDPVVVWDEATNSGVQLDDATSPALEGSYTVQGFACKTVFTTVMEKITDYTLEKAAEICDLTEDQIVYLAETYATEGPVYVMTFQGIGHHVNSHHNYKNLALLAALTGNVGKPGASYCGAPSCGMLGFNVMAYMMGMTGPSFTGMWLPKVMEEGKWGDQDLTIRVLWINNGNVLSCESGRAELIEAVKKVDFVITADEYLNDSAQWSDLVLPVPHSFEELDVDPICSTPYPQIYQKCIEPLYDCKPDLDIMRMLASAMGMDFLYGDNTDDDFLHLVLDTDANIAGGASWDDLKSGKMIRNYGYTKDDEIWKPGTDESTRLGYYIENPAPRDNFGQAVADYERYPYFEHAHEAYWDNPDREKYPLLGCSQHHKYHVHSQLAFTPCIRELEPEPQLKINTVDAEARGIKQNDYVRAYNDHGSAVLRAMVTEGIKPGVVSIPHGFQREQFLEGHAQDLTNVYMNDFCSNSSFYDFICEVELYKGRDEK